MARLHLRNFGVARRLQGYPPRRSYLQSLDRAIATLLFSILLFGAGLAALGWWLLRGMLLLMMRCLRSQRSLPSPRLLPASVRSRFFRYRRDRWCRALELASGR